MSPKRKMLVLWIVIGTLLALIAGIGISAAVIAQVESDRRECEMFRDMTGGDPSTC